MDYKAIWALIQDNLQALTPFYQEAMGGAIQDSGVPDYWFGLSLARGCEPEPFTFNRFRELSPYANRDRVAILLEPLVEADMFERVGVDTYVLTDIGREIIEGIHEAAHRVLEEIEPLPKTKMSDLNELLLQLVEAIVLATEPADKWSFCYSRWTDPGRDVAGVVRIDQYLTDLYRFRDDAHVAAWVHFGISGGAWEVLTTLWREGGKSPAELVETLSFREQGEEDYVKILGELGDQGWVENLDQIYQVTDAGETIRQEAENETERIYFAPWEVLNGEQFDELKSLLELLKDNLEQMASSNDQ